MPRQGPANGSPSCWPHSEVWPGLCVYAGCPSLAPLLAAHCLPRRCVGSALHGRFGTTLSPGTVLPHCYYCAAYLIALFCAGGVTSPPFTDCYPTAPRLLCGWSDGLEWSPGCAASDASSPLCSIPLWPQDHIV